MKRTLSFLQPKFFLICVAIVIALIVLIIYNNKLLSKKLPEDLSKNYPSRSGYPLSTGDYQSSHFLYRLKVPIGWEMNEETWSDGKEGSTSFITPSEYPRASFGVPTLGVSIVSEDRSSELGDYSGITTQTHFDTWRKVKTRPDGDEYNNFAKNKVRNEIVDGVPAVRLLIENPEEIDETYYRTITWVRRNDTNYYIAFYSSNKEDLENYEDIYEEAISSFEFLN